MAKTTMQNVELLFQAKNIEFSSNREREQFLRKLKILALPVGTTIYVDPLEFENSFNLYSKRKFDTHFLVSNF